MLVQLAIVVMSCSPKYICAAGMNRKRALVSDTFKVKKRKTGSEKFGVVDDHGDGMLMAVNVFMYIYFFRCIRKASHICFFPNLF